MSSLPPITTFKAINDASPVTTEANDTLSHKKAKINDPLLLAFLEQARVALTSEKYSHLKWEGKKVCELSSEEVADFIILANTQSIIDIIMKRNDLKFNFTKKDPSLLSLVTK